MKIVYIVPEDRAFLNQRKELALKAKEAGYDVHVYSTLSPQSPQITDLGFTYHNINLSRDCFNPLKEISVILKICELHFKVRPDIVHNISIKPVFYGTIAARICNIPKIVNLINGLGFVFNDGGVLRKLIRTIISSCYFFIFKKDNIDLIFQNPDDKDYFLSQKFCSEKQAHLILGSGVNTNRFKFSQPSNNSITFAFISRMIWEKGVYELIEAARQLRSNGYDFDLLFIGEPDKKNPTSVPLKFLRQAHNDQVINYLGHQNDLPLLLEKVHVTILPTYYKEGIPLSLIESASSGKALITTDTPGCREIVKNYHNGVLIKPRDTHSLYEAMKKILDGDYDIKLLGSNSRKLVEESFSIDIIAQQTIDIYKKKQINKFVKPHPANFQIQQAAMSTLAH